jgi:hypothetical protein
VPYLASWAEQAPIETIEATAALIDRVARRIEDALEPAGQGGAGVGESELSAAA